MSTLRRTDLLSLSSLRNDGRTATQIRRITTQISPLPSTTTTSGSATFSMGLTTALASIRGPTESSRRDELSDRAHLSVSLRIAPFASSDRRTVNPQSDRRCLEQANWIQNALGASVMLHLFPRAKIEVEIWILSDDGGRLSCAINAATLALVDAGIPLKDMVCSVSAGLSSGGEDVELVDLNRAEMMSAGGESAVCLVLGMMPQRGTIVLAQCESRLDMNKFEICLKAAEVGCQQVFEIMAERVRERGAVLLACKSGNVQVKVSE